MKESGVEEVRRARHEISEECGHNLHKVVEFYRSVEDELRRSGRFLFEETTPPIDAGYESPGSKRKIVS